jgi:hypothetical protein
MRKIPLSLAGAAFFLLAIPGTAGEIPFSRAAIDEAGPRDPWIKVLADLDGDGLADAAVGGAKGPLVWYASPHWTRATVAEGGYDTVGARAADLDGDGDRDLLLGGALWYENPRPAADPGKGPWKAHRIAAHRTHDIEAADLDGDGRVDAAARGQGALGKAIIVWRRAGPEAWAAREIPAPEGEGLAAADIDRDGDVDLAIGGRWYESPGRDLLKAPWTERTFAEWHRDAVVCPADVDGDGRTDLVLTASEAPYRASWFAAPADPRAGRWEERPIDPSVDFAHGIAAGDLDGDGDVDVAVSEMHQSARRRVLVYENGGRGAAWSSQVLSTKGSHNIAAGDIDGDGDLDLLGANWSGPYQPIELWRCGARDWKHLSSRTGDLESPGGSLEQTAALVLDIDRDGTNDFAIACRIAGPSLIVYLRSPGGWRRLVADPEMLPVEAGGTAADIDGDGDQDIVMGGDWQGKEVWWWENPCPAFDPARPWKRRTVKSGGATKHHHQLFGDFDGDGREELAFWNQGARTLFLARIPADPRSAASWPIEPIYTYAGGEHEGLAKADVDGDGRLDIVGGGRWFKRGADGRFSAEVIDDAQRFAKAAAGQLVPGGRAEAVFVPGDAVGRLRWYGWDGSRWVAHDLLLGDAVHGHSLEIADLDGDGNLDIFCAEMAKPGHGEKATMWVFLGDGKGSFRTRILATGIGNHESRAADLDGDGDVDILGKPYNWDTPRLDVWLNPRIGARIGR